MKKAWQSWKKVTKKVVAVQAFVIFTILYILIIAPTGLFIQVFFPGILKDLLRKRDKSYWIKRNITRTNITWAKKQ